jgi:hypothetical protein
MHGTQRVFLYFLNQFSPTTKLPPPFQGTSADYLQRQSYILFFGSFSEDQHSHRPPPSSLLLSHARHLVYLCLQFSLVQTLLATEIVIAAQCKILNTLTRRFWAVYMVLHETKSPAAEGFFWIINLPFLI